MNLFLLLFYFFCLSSQHWLLITTFASRRYFCFSSLLLLSSPLNMSHENQRKELLKQHWPIVHTNPPQPWTVPLVMTARASIPFVKLARNDQLFKNHNMEATMEILIEVPAWLLKDFSGMIQSHEGTVLEFYMYRFHFGSLTVKDWEDQSFQITFYPKLYILGTLTRCYIALCRPS
jgi:hypothetical protein